MLVHMVADKDTLRQSPPNQTHGFLEETTVRCARKQAGKQKGVSHQT